MTDQMKVDILARNKYSFDFGGGGETIVADGTDDPGNAGTILSVTVEGGDTWEVVRNGYRPHVSRTYRPQLP
jgi:hypothetical protein